MGYACEISAVVPVYGSNASLSELCNRLVIVLTSLGKDYEIIFVDDCSPGQEWETLEQLASSNECIRIVQLAKNSGQPVATLCGLSMARGAVVVTLDDDLQHPPEEIPKLLASLTEDLDVVMGVPEQRRHHWLRGFSSSFLQGLNRQLLGIPKGLRFSSFRAMRAHTVEAITVMKPIRPVIGNLIFKVTDRIGNVRFEHFERGYGESRYSSKRLVGMAVDAIVGPSTLALRILALVGFVGTFLPASIGVFLLARFLLVGSVVPGWLSTMLLLLFLAGLYSILFSFFGLFLVRILDGLRDPVGYSVRKVSPPANESSRPGSQGK